MSPDSSHARPVVVCNPASGSGDHREEVHARADERRYAVRETEREGDADLKGRIGTAAYVLKTARALPRYEGVTLSVRAFGPGGEEPLWSGDAVLLLVGNGRRFSVEGSAQADMEDGRFDVTVVRDDGWVDLLSTAAVERVLGQASDRTIRDRVPSLGIEVQGGPVAFSLDGEIVRRSELSLRVRPRALRFAVGDDYDPSPDG